MRDDSTVLDADCIDAATLEEVAGLELVAQGAVEGLELAVIGVSSPV